MALDQQVVSEYNDFTREVNRLQSGYFREAREDLLFYSGSMLSSTELAQLKHENRVPYQINKIRRGVNLLSGYEREHRVSTVVGGIEESDDLTAEQLTTMMLYTYDKGNAHSIISECFDHSLKTGLGVIGIDMDYTTDRVSGDIKFWWKPYNAVLIDPYFTKRDLSDADRAATRDLLSKDHVKNLLPDVSAKDIDALSTNVGNHDFPFYVVNQTNLNNAADNLVTYDRFWRRINRKATFLVNMNTGEQIEITDFEDDDVNTLILILKLEAAKDGEQEPDLDVISTTTPSIELNIIVSDVLMYRGPDRTEVDNFPFITMMPSFEPYVDDFSLRIQGIVRSGKDANRLYNRRVNQLTDLMESSINSGWKVVNGAVQDPESLKQTGQAKIVVVEPGHDPDREVQQLTSGGIPPGLLEMMPMIDRDLLDSMGSNEEELGIADGGNTQISGRLAEMRASKGMIGSRYIFDHYEDSLKGLGGLVIEALQKTASEGKVKRITNQEPTPAFKSRAFDKYDATVKQAILTKTQRDAYYFELKTLREMGIGITDSEIIDAAPVQSVTKLGELVKAREEAAQQEQQRIREAEERTNQLSDATLAAQVARTGAETAREFSQEGLNIERRARAEEDLSNAALNRAKAMTEIENLKTDNLMKLAQIVQILEPSINDAQVSKPTTGVSNVKGNQGSRQGSILKESNGDGSTSQGV